MSKVAPKYAQVADALREYTATLKPGDRFPSHTVVAERFAVSEGTALRALEALRRDGVIVRRNGIGTFVSDFPASRQNSADDLAAEPSGPASRVPIVAVLALSDDSFFQNCVRVVTAQSGERGLSVVCHYAQEQANFSDALPLEALRPQGFLIFSYALFPVAAVLRERGHRVVVVGVPPVDAIPTLPCVYSDHDYGGRIVARHLLDLGHRRIAFVRSEGENPVFPSYRLLRRWHGHVRTLRASPNVPDPELTLTGREIDGWRADPEAAVRYFARPEAPTAIVTWNDGAALQLLRLLDRAGIRVPDDVSIIGYDNLPGGADMNPPLTTVDQHIEAQIAQALSLLSREEETASVIAIPTLVSRSSCAPPRSP